MKISKRKKDITAGVVILVSLGVIVGTLVHDTNSTDTAIALRDTPVATATATPLSSVSAKPRAVTPPRVNSSTVPNDYTKLNGSTITYITSGSPAKVSYGSSASEFGTVPMNKTEIIRGSYYSLMVRMDDGGYKTKIVVKINGKTVAKTYATANHQIASIAVTQEYGTNKWVAIPSTS